MLSNKLDRVIENIIGTVLNLHGNHTEVEYLLVAQHLKSLDKKDLKHIHNLPHPEEHDDYEDEYGDW